MVLESLRFKSCFRRLFTFFKINTHGKPKYLLNKIQSSQVHYNTRNADQVDTFYYRTNIFKNFFPYTTISWNKADLDVCKSKSYVIFRNTLLKLGRFNQCAIYSISSPVGLKLFTRLRLGLNHLNEHRINQSFKTTLTFV